MTSRVLVIMPTYNERANLLLLIPALMRHAGVDLLVVDDQSPDGTADLAESLGREHAGRIDVLRRQALRGFGRSYVDGMKRALGRPYDVLCQMDADLSHDPAQLPDLIAAIPHADVVIGSRYVSGGSVVNWPRRRRILSRIANVYIRGVTRLQVRDSPRCPSTTSSPTAIRFSSRCCSWRPSAAPASPKSRSRLSSDASANRRSPGPFSANPPSHPGDSFRGRN
ncbi:MAG: hypothetical protein DMF90_04215 [Acidobacteria bacterium]|nr:MAG: hypothetical protein DMF90_04215 [Acidobacteriota bacterium]